MKLLRVHGLTAALWLAHCLGHAESLPQLIDGVLASHPSLRAQRALGASAQQALEAARWQFYPTPSIGFEQVDAGNSDPSYAPNGDKNVTTLRLQQPLWTGGRLSAGLDKAGAGVLAGEASQDSVRHDLALRVVQVYADWYGAQLKHQAYEKSLHTHHGLQEQIDRRINGGISPQSDLTLLLGRQQQTEADLATAQALEQSALARLGQLLGRPLQSRDLATALGAAQALDLDVQDLQAQAQAHHPSVQKLHAQARMAEAEVSERRADLLPAVYLRVERQYGNFSYPDISAQSRVFVGFSTSFGAGLSSLSQVSGALARYEAALADIDSTRVSLGEQIMGDYAQAQAGQDRLLALQASLQSADGITRAWNRQFVAGRKTWLDVMNAAREAVQLEAQIADARASQLLLSWRLSITGKGLDNALSAALSATPNARVNAALDTVSDTAQSAVQSDLTTKDTQAPGDADIPLYAQDEAIELRMAWQIDPGALGRDVSKNTYNEAQW